jgi:hypothetical protein
MIGESQNLMGGSRSAIGGGQIRYDIRVVQVYPDHDMAGSREALRSRFTHTRTGARHSVNAHSSNAC